MLFYMIDIYFLLLNLLLAGAIVAVIVW